MIGATGLVVSAATATHHLTQLNEYSLGKVFKLAEVRKA
jgi:hypothetical protein